MPDQDWKKVREIFDSALRLPPGKREQFVRAACSEDDALQAEVVSLLSSFGQAEEFLEKPAVEEVAAELTSDRWLAPGSTINHYKIIEQLGEGGMGAVYLAEDTRLNRRVALKILQNLRLSDQKSRKFLLREAQAAAKLDHPNICAIHEVGQSDTGDFIVMQFIEGETLANKLDRGKLGANEARNLAIQIADALGEAHSHNIIHRDIKPANIIVTPKGQPKVLDFGLAKFIQPDGEEVRANTQSTDGMIMGTIPYMSPEQVRGKPLDERSDIFSFGAMFHEMLSGVRPFERDNNAETISALINDEPSYSAIPTNLRPILQKCLAKDRDQRYRTMGDLLSGLGAAATRLHEAEDTALLETQFSQLNTADVAQTATGGAPGATTGAIRSPRRRFLIGAAIAAVVLVLATAGIYSFRGGKTGVTSPIRSIAILPARSLAANDTYLGIGIADAVIRRLSQSGQLTVRPTSAVLHYANQDTDAVSAARELNTDAVLESTVQRSGQRLRVSVNLLRADGNSLWAENFDMPESDIFVIQDTVAEQVAAQLRLHLDSSRQAGLDNKYPVNPVAYEFYIRGLVSLDERGYQEGLPQMAATIDFFKKSIEADPNYALAHAQLAFAYAWTATAIEPSVPKWAEFARAEMARAQELNPKLAETHLANAILLWSYYGDYQIEEAIREDLTARQLNPNSSHGELAAMYGHIGLDDLASEELRRELEIDPTSQSLKDLTMILPYLRADADAWYAEREKLPPSAKFASPWYYLQKGRLDDAQNSLDERLPRSSRNFDLLMQEALLHALKGQIGDAKERVSEIIAMNLPNDQSRHHTTYTAACVYALAGDSGEAVKWLRETASTGFPNYPLFERDHYLDRIRQSPDFIQFMTEQKARFERNRQEFGG